MILTDKAKEEFLNYYWDNYIGNEIYNSRS